MTLVKDILVHARKLDPKEIPAAVAAGVVAAKAAPTQSALDVAYERMLRMSAWGSPFRTAAIDPGFDSATQDRTDRSWGSAFGGAIGGMLSGGH